MESVVDISFLRHRALQWLLKEREIVDFPGGQSLLRPSILPVLAIWFALQGHQTLDAAHLDLLLWVAPTFCEAPDDTTTGRKGSFGRRFLPLS